MAIAVNGVEIAESAVLAEMQYHPAESADAARRMAAEALVVRELLRQEAQARGFGDDESAFDALLEADVATPAPDEETCRRYFENNRKRFGSPELFEAQHILVAAMPDDEPDWSAAQAKAAALARQVADDPARFEALARQHSACPSASGGGHLGQIGRGSLVPELESYVFAMQAGETCPVPVASRYGWHIVRVIARTPTREITFAEARARVADHLTAASWRRAVSQYIALLAGRARIEGLSLRSAPSPLVQ